MNFYTKIFIGAAIISFFVKLFLAQFMTSFGDLLTYKAWGVYLAEHGSNSFYSNLWSDYLPGYLYVLWFLSKISSILQLQGILIPDYFLYKLPSMLADIGNAYFIFKIVQYFTSKRNALILSIILLSSFYYLLSGRYWLSAILLAFGQTVKPVAVFSIPLYIIYICFKNRYLTVINYLLIFAIVIVLLFIPFNNNHNIFQFIIDRHLVTSNQYPYTTLHALNFWSMLDQFWTSDKLMFLNLDYQKWGYILFGLVYLLVISILLRKKERNLPVIFSYALSICYLAMFLFLTRMHERHMFYGLGLLMLITPTISRFSNLVISMLYLTYVFSLYYALSQSNQRPLMVERIIIEIISLVSLIILAYIIVLFYKKNDKNT